jgi:hypothetical protein
MTSIDPRQNHVRVRIKNVKSGRYLSLQGTETEWGNDEIGLSIKDLMEDELVLESPQVWNIIQYRDNEWIMMNQYSKYLACIHDRKTDNDVPAVQYHSQFLPTEPFQEWYFQPLFEDKGIYLIENCNSQKFIGPYERHTEDGTPIIQYDDQTSEDTYQEWVFEEV